MTGIRTLQRNVLDWVVKNHPFLGLDRRAESFVRHFEPYLDPNSAVLDIGGGWGYYAEPLESRGHDVTVLDVVKPGFQKAPVVVYDGISPFPFPDKSFDASMLITVLHHIPDPVQVIREARRVTKGVLFVVEDLYHHAMGRLWTQLRDQVYNFEFFGHPCQFKTRDEWVRIFEAEGFTLLSDKKIYTWLSGMRILNGIFVLSAE